VRLTKHRAVRASRTIMKTNTKNLISAALAVFVLTGCAGMPDLQSPAARGQTAANALTAPEPAERETLASVTQAGEKAFQAADAAAKAYPSAVVTSGATIDSVSFTSAGRTWAPLKRYQLILCDIPARPLAAKDPASVEFAKAMAMYAGSRKEPTKFGIIANKADAAFLKSVVSPVLKAKGVKLETTVTTKGPSRLAFMSTAPVVRRVP
jgi:hypothetical protein